MLPKPRERGRHAGEHLARGQVPLVFRQIEGERVLPAGREHALEHAVLARPELRADLHIGEGRAAMPLDRVAEREKPDRKGVGDRAVQIEDGAGQPHRVKSTAVVLPPLTTTPTRSPAVGT